MNGFKNCNIYLNNKEIKKGSLEFSNTINSFNEPTDNFITLEDKYTVVPGFIDKHTHGVDGFKFNNATIEQMKHIVLAKAKEGVTTQIATLATQSDDATRKSIEQIIKFMDTEELGKGVLGICLEGPYLSQEYKGGHPGDFLTRGTIEHFNSLVGNNIKYIKQICVSPEVCDENFIKYLTDNNIVVCVAHAATNYEQMQKAMNEGLNCLTHVFSGMTPLAGADIGITGIGLLEDELYCEVIPDLFTVSEGAMKLLYKCKGNDKLCVITDSSASSHLPNGVHKVGAKEVHVNNKRATNAEGKFAGSIIWVNDGVRNFKNTLNLSLENSINLAAKNNASALKETSIGSIELNNEANFTVVDNDLNVLMTILNGKVIFNNL